MAWYVFALLDAAPHGRIGGGFGAPLAMRDLGSCVAAVERRADVPPLELDALQAHHRVVARIWRHTSAVLPVRFGTLLDGDELHEAVEHKDEELRDAFALVRNRGQFSWRTPAARARAARAAARQRTTSVSGTEYLRRAARAATPPARFAPIRRVLGPLAAAERYQRSRTTISDALYHLVDRTRIPEYRAAAATLRLGAAPPRCTGPFPPYAFAPEILR